MKRSSVTLLFVLVVLVLVFALSAAASRAEEGGGQGTGDYLVFLPAAANPLAPIIPDTTVVLGEETTQYLQSVAGDLSVFTFAQMTPALAEVDSGDVIVSGPAGAAPFGFLRAVTAVSETGGAVEVHTAPAALTEAIQQGEANWSASFGAEDVISVAAREGVHVQLGGPGTGAPADGEFYITVPNLGDSCFNVTGSITVPRFNVEFDMEIHSWNLEELRFVVSQQVIDDISVSVVCAASRDREWPLAQFYMSPIVVFVGWVPVVFVPKMDVVLGIDGTVSAGLSLEANLDVTVRGGVVYEDGAFDAVGEFTPIVDGSMDPVAGVSAKVYAGPELSLLLYGLSGPYMQNVIYAEGEVDIGGDPWWTLYWGVEANVGVELEIFGHDLVEWSGPAIGYRDVLAQSGGDEAPTSTFDGTSTDGWTLHLGTLENPGSGGSGGGADNGYLYAEPPGENRTSYFVAPAAYHGDWREYNTLNFELWSSGGSYYTSGYSMYGDVYLANGARTARLMLGSRPGSSWESFIVWLDESEAWTLGGGATSLEEVLFNVTDFQIRAEYGVGDDETGLDNVALDDSPVETLRGLAQREREGALGLVAYQEGGIVR